MISRWTRMRVRGVFPRSISAFCTAQLEEAKLSQFYLTPEESKPLTPPTFDGEWENPTSEQLARRQELAARLISRATEGSSAAPERPLAIELDLSSSFEPGSNRYTTQARLKHRALTILGYNVLHIPHTDWWCLNTDEERIAYLRAKVETARKQPPSEWLDPQDAVLHTQALSGS
eukprot:GDKH01006064.1.p1 GENE.GDKH01006064.1~~GDKH01006064.1.p1  ORF type:complete len:175 (+),score=15.27 GDKH01006064.1:89-613(+)